MKFFQKLPANRFQHVRGSNKCDIALLPSSFTKFKIGKEFIKIVRYCFEISLINFFPLSIYSIIINTF